MSAGTQPIAQRHDHVCLIHYGESSRRPVILQWIREAAPADEVVLLIEPPETAEAITDLIGDPADRILFRSPAEAYAGDHDGAARARRLTEPAGSPTHATRAVGKISSPASHALALMPDADTYLEFERQLDAIAHRDGVAVLCQYDRVVLYEEVVVRAAAAHTVVVQLDDLALPTLDLRPTDDGMRVSGEIDAANAAIVASWMARHRGRPLVVDCSNLTFMDVAGYHALTTCASDDTPIVLTRVNGAPQKLLSVLPDELGRRHVSAGST